MGLLSLNDANKHLADRGTLGKDTSAPLEKTSKHNPLTASGKKVMSSMKNQYGKRGEEVFYASINKGVKGSKGWHK